MAHSSKACLDDSLRLGDHPLDESFAARHLVNKTHHRPARPDGALRVSSLVERRAVVVTLHEMIDLVNLAGELLLQLEDLILRRGGRPEPKGLETREKMSVRILRARRASHREGEHRVSMGMGTG